MKSETDYDLRAARRQPPGADDPDLIGRR